MEQQMSRQAAVLEEALCARGGTLQSRLRERSTGVVQDLPADVLLLSGLPLCPEEVVPALEELAMQGVVVCCVVVHPFDSSEYRVIWRVTGRRQAAPCQPAVSFNGNS